MVERYSELVRIQDDDDDSDSDSTKSDSCSSASSSSTNSLSPPPSYTTIPITDTTDTFQPSSMDISSKSLMKRHLLVTALIIVFTGSVIIYAWLTGHRNPDFTFINADGRI